MLDTGPEIPLLLLESEAEELIPAKDLERRRFLVKQFARLPVDIWGRIEYLQPQIGCFNACAFCSQSAGSTVWQIDRSMLRNLMSAIKSVGRHHAKGGDSPLIGAARLEHKPGVIFPYLDNDIFSYEHIDEYIRILNKDLGCKVRLTSVGYSRHNRVLDGAHQRVAKELVGAIDGLRLSFTPYTLGWTETSSTTRLSREEFVCDFAHTLKTYRPVLEHIGPGKDRFCIEVRFAPLCFSEEADLYQAEIDGYRVIGSGPHLLISTAKGVPVPRTMIEKLEGKVPQYSSNGLPFLLITDDRMADPTARQLLVEALHGIIPDMDAMMKILPPGAFMRHVQVYEFCNQDGPYFAADPFFDTDKRFHAICFYPRTAARTRSGFIDATRYLLDAILGVKGELEAAGRTPVGDDIDDVYGVLTRWSQTLETRYSAAAVHIGENVLPLVRSLMESFHRAVLDPTLFFHSGFLIDTGEIVNQGRAHAIFKGLASAPEIPLSPHGERGYGSVSFNALRSPVFRLAPIASLNSDKTRLAQLGRRNVPSPSGGLLFEELDGWLRPTGTSYVCSGVETRQIKFKPRDNTHVIPGFAPEPSSGED